jgi:hypothetical protein
MTAWGLLASVMGTIRSHPLEPSGHVNLAYGASGSTISFAISNPEAIMEAFANLRNGL